MRVRRKASVADARCWLGVARAAVSTRVADSGIRTATPAQRETCRRPASDFISFSKSPCNHTLRQIPLREVVHDVRDTSTYDSSAVLPEQRAPSSHPNIYLVEGGNLHILRGGARNEASPSFEVSSI